MRHLPKLSDDYGFSGGSESDAGLQASLFDRDIEQIVESYGDDWSLDGDDVDFDAVN